MTEEEHNREDSTEDATEDQDAAKGDNAQVVDDDQGEKGLGSESGAAGGAHSPPNNPDPSTKGSVKGNDRAN